MTPKGGLCFLRPGTGYKERRFLIGDRAREAIAAYLKFARDGGWLVNASRLEGPLWIASHHHGTQQRMSQRTAMQAWRSFLDDADVSQEYQLDDIVLTGRIAFLEAANGSTEVLSEHTGLSRIRAGHYLEHMVNSPSSTARDVLSQVSKQQKRKGSA